MHKVQDRLKQYLEENGIKKNFFAKKIGVTPHYLWRIIKGEYLPSEELAYVLESKTNGFISADEILKERMENARNKFNERLKIDEVRN